MASDINTICVSGRLTKPPTYSTSSAGVPYASLTVACNEEVYDPRTGKWEPIATFFDCVAFSDLADDIRSRGLTMGTKVMATGHMRMGPRMVPGTDIVYKYPSVVLSDLDSAEPRPRQWKASVWRNRTDG